MAKDNTILIIAGIIILFLVLPKIDFSLDFSSGGLFSIVGYEPDSKDLIYQTFRSGSQCSSNFYQSHSTYGKLYLSDVTGVVVYDAGTFYWNVPGEYCQSSIYFYEGASIPGTPYAACLPFPDSSTASNYPSSGTLSDGLGGFCKSIQQYCIDENLPNYQQGQSASYDPNEPNGIPEIKCNAYCKPNLGTCVMRGDGRWESQICRPDGTSIVHKVCVDECDAGVCVGSEAIYIDIEPLSNLVIGEDVNVYPTLLFHDALTPNEELVGTIYQNQQQIAGPVTGFTDSSGVALLQFKNVQAIKGFATLVVTADIEGLTGLQELDIYFDDIPPVVIDFPSTTQTYYFGDSVETTLRLYLGATPQPNIMMVGKIWNEGQVVASDTETTDSNGYVTFNFYDVEAIGPAELRVTVHNIAGRDVEAVSKMVFSGSLLQFETTTSSYIQPNKNPIKYMVNVKDNKYREITLSQITNLHAEATLSNGEIVYSEVQYFGNGDYEASVDVTGTGIFLGRIGFNYLGGDFISPAIQIDVRVTTISVDVSQIPVASMVGITETISFSLVSSTGELIDPDEIEVIITLPTGFEDKTLTKTDLTKVSEGVYSFDYTFNQVEKHTFDIYADKGDYAKGHARASVVVSGVDDDTFGPSIGLGNLEYILYAVIAFIIFIFFMRRKG